MRCCISLAVISFPNRDHFLLPCSCDKFWECKEGIATLELCGNGEGFADLDPTYTTKNCDYLYNVECGNRTDVEPAISAPNCPRLYGTFPDPDDCAAFYNCRDGLANRFTCAPGLAFDENSRVCKWTDQVQRCKDLKALQIEDEEENEEFICPDNVPVGIFSKHAHPADCRQYFVCISGVPREYGCPLGTVFKIGGSEFDGKCADPEEVPECANYYGDLEFDKQELVRAGVDPEAVGAKVAPAGRVRVGGRSRLNRPKPPPPPPAPIIEEEEEEEAFVPRAPPRPPVRNSNSFRSRPSRPRTRTESKPAPPPPPPPPTPAPTTPRPILLPEPVNSVPVVPRVEVPAIPLASLSATKEGSTVTLPSSPASPAAAAAPVSPSSLPAAGGLGQPAKVKAGEDYYYYYYYYDEDEDGEINDDAAGAN